MVWRSAKKIGSGVLAGGTWVLVLPVAVDEGVVGWKRWLGISEDQSVGDAVNVLYQQFGPLSVLFPIAAMLGWWAWWYPPKWLRRRFARRPAVWAGEVVNSTLPVPKTWISREGAEEVIKRSSLVRMRVPAVNITVLEALLRQAGAPPTKTPGETRADELARKLLRTFEAQNPAGVRNGQYGKELLEWWIEEQADQMAP